MEKSSVIDTSTSAGAKCERFGENTEGSEGRSGIKGNILIEDNPNKEPGGHDEVIEANGIQQTEGRSDEKAGNEFASGRIHGGIVRGETKKMVTKERRVGIGKEMLGAVRKGRGVMTTKMSGAVRKARFGMRKGVAEKVSSSVAETRKGALGKLRAVCAGSGEDFFESREVFMQHIPPLLFTKEALKLHFENFVPNGLTDISLRGGRPNPGRGKAKRTAKLTFVSAEVASKAMETGNVFTNIKLDMKYFIPRERRVAYQQMCKSKRLNVQNFEKVEDQMSTRMSSSNPSTLTKTSGETVGRGLHRNTSDSISLSSRWRKVNERSSRIGSTTMNTESPCASDLLGSTNEVDAGVLQKVIQRDPQKLPSNKKKYDYERASTGKTEMKSEKGSAFRISSDHGVGVRKGAEHNERALDIGKGSVAVQSNPVLIQKTACQKSKIVCVDPKVERETFHRKRAAGTAEEMRQDISCAHKALHDLKQVTCVQAAADKETQASKEEILRAIVGARADQAIRAKDSAIVAAKNVGAQTEILTKANEKMENVPAKRENLHAQKQKEAAAQTKRILQKEEQAKAAALAKEIAEVEAKAKARRCAKAEEAMRKLKDSFKIMIMQEKLRSIECGPESPVALWGKMKEMIDSIECCTTAVETASLQASYNRIKCIIQNINATVLKSCLEEFRDVQDIHKSVAKITRTLSELASEMDDRIDTFNRKRTEQHPRFDFDIGKYKADHRIMNSLSQESLRNHLIRWKVALMEMDRSVGESCRELLEIPYILKKSCPERTVLMLSEPKESTVPHSWIGLTPMMSNPSADLSGTNAALVMMSVKDGKLRGPDVVERLQCSLRKIASQALEGTISAIPVVVVAYHALSTQSESTSSREELEQMLNLQHLRSEGVLSNWHLVEVFESDLRRENLKYALKWLMETSSVTPRRSRLRMIRLQDYVIRDLQPLVASNRASIGKIGQRLETWQSVLVIANDYLQVLADRVRRMGNAWPKDFGSVRDDHLENANAILKLQFCFKRNVGALSGASWTQAFYESVQCESMDEQTAVEFLEDFGCNLSRLVPLYVKQRLGSQCGNRLWTSGDADIVGHKRSARVISGLSAIPSSCSKLRRKARS